MDIKRLANRLSQQYGTRNPFQIAVELGYIILNFPLEGIRGYYQYTERCHIIYLDNNLSEEERRWVCAHELGHSLLHNGLNRIFMDTHTHMVSSRYEQEADKFAVELLFSDEDLHDLLSYSITEVAQCLGVGNELAEYRMRSVKRLKKL